MNRAEMRRRRKKAEKAPKKVNPRQGANRSPGQQTPTIQKSLDLAVQHYIAGRFPQAERIYQQILQIDPNQPVPLHHLGVIALQVGKNDIAVELITRAIAIKPDYAKAHYNLGFAFKKLGKLDEAVASYHKALAVKPDYAKAHYNLGNAFLDLVRLDEAVASYNTALAIKPDFAKAHYNLGNALGDLGKSDGAVASYRKALAINPDYATAHYNLGNTLQDLEKSDEAVASYRKALVIKPDYAEAHNNLGGALQDLGKLDEAVASYRKALAIRPDDAEAHRHLAIVKKFSEYDNDIKAMEDTYAMPSLSDEQRMHLAFGLGKSFEDLQQHERAFGFFLTGNAEKRRTYDFSVESEEKDFGKLKKLFTKNLFTKHQRAGSSDESPIFVLGMPRSGTTLVEQILASHPKIYGAGELDYLIQVVESNFNKIDDAKFTDNVNHESISDFSSAGNEYISMIREHSDTARFITDKMPGNFSGIGMIKLMLPNAKVIHCCRNPLDTCVSIFKTYFSREGHYYAYDLRELGQYYNLYRDLMNHWHGVLPDFIFDIQYEDVVADQENQSRALLEYCGLEWDDTCLEFYRTDRPVRTASAAQVRRPIYKDSVQSWKRYENWLSPLLEVLR